MLRRSFRNVAVVAGLIERRHPGEEKSRKQITFNADLIYDVCASTSRTTSCCARLARTPPGT